MRFGKFLNSPYFNKRKQLKSLFSVLKKYYPEFDSKKITKENIYKQIYKNQRFNDSTIRNLMSDLLQSTLLFIRQKGLEKNEIDSSFYLTEELFARGCFNLFMSIMSKNKNLLEKSDTSNSDYFFNHYKVNTDCFYVNILTQKVLKKPYVISESNRLVEGIVSILNYFVMETMKHNENLLQYSRSYNIQKNIKTVSSFLEIFNFEKVLSYVKNNSSAKVPIIELYYNLLNALTHFENEKFYFEFKKSLYQYSINLGIADNNFLHLRLIGYCISKINLGLHTSFDVNKELFELLQTYIKNGFYKTESSKYLPFDIYRIVLINCISVKKLSYMEEFIRVYSKELLPKHIESIESYGYALLNFEKREFTKALNFINQIKFDQFVYKLDMKNLQLKIHYELGDLELALSVVDTYKHFLKNTALLAEGRLMLHNNFVNYTNQLIQHRAGSTKINLPYLSNKINSSKKIFDKVWLQDKIKELTRKKVA